MSDPKEYTTLRLIPTGNVGICPSCAVSGKSTYWGKCGRCGGKGSVELQMWVEVGTGMNIDQLTGREPEPVNAKCPSCGVPWKDHIGIAGTCYKLQRLISALNMMIDLPGCGYSERREIQRILKEVSG